MVLLSGEHLGPGGTLQSARAESVQSMMVASVINPFFRLPWYFWRPSSVSIALLCMYAASLFGLPGAPSSSWFVQPNCTEVATQFEARLVHEVSDANVVHHMPVKQLQLLERVPGTGGHTLSKTNVKPAKPAAKGKTCDTWF